MRVDTPDSDYQFHMDDWRTCRDVLSGRRAIHAGGERYLPRLHGQEDSEYEAYQVRAGWYGATGRTKQALSGMLFRKPVELKAKDRMQDLAKNITQDGVSLNGFASKCIDEVLSTGRAGILVDHERTPTDGLSQADYERMNLRPYLQLYSAEQIISYRQGIVNNQRVITQVRLKEVTEKQGTSEFEVKHVERIRVLELADGTYQQRLFEQSEGNFELIDTIIPSINGQPFDYIPFFFVGATNTLPDYDRPPLLDIAEINIDLYRTKADYKHGLHFTGLPTAVISGVRNQEGKEYRIGSTTAWVFPDHEADAKYLEFQGQGLQEIREEIKSLKDDMAAMGVRLLATEKRAVESAESHTIKRSGEHSILASIANNASKVLTNAMNVVAEWAGLSEDVSVHMNTDFIPLEMSTQEMLHMWQLVQSGGLTDQDYMWNLRQGERLDPNIDDEERMSMLQTQPTL